MRKKWVLVLVLLLAVFVTGGLVIYHRSSKENTQIPYINDESADWNQVTQAEVYRDGSAVPPTTVIQDKDSVEELVQALREIGGYKKVPDEKRLEGIMDVWIRFDNGVVIGLYENENYGYIGTELSAIGTGNFYHFPKKFYEMIVEGYPSPTESTEPADESFAEIGELDTDQHQIQTIAEQAFQAYFQNDMETLNAYAYEEGQLETYGDGGEDAQIPEYTIKGLEQFSDREMGEVGSSAAISCEFKEKPEDDFYQYLTMEFVKAEDGWKIRFLGLEG